MATGRLRLAHYKAISGSNSVVAIMNHELTSPEDTEPACELQLKSCPYGIPLENNLGKDQTATVKMKTCSDAWLL